MNEPTAWLNGRFLPQGEARLPLNDAGFVLGATVTDLCRTFRHRPYRLPEHLARFRASCASACVPLLASDIELTAIAEELVAHNARLIDPSQDLAIVFLSTPGPVGFYLGEPGGPGDGPPSLIVHTFPLPFSRYAPLFQRGANLVIPDSPHVPADCIDRHIKHRSRLFWWLADRAARQREPGSSALLRDGDTLTETSTSNFLIVRDGVVTSPPHGTVLAGVSLAVVQELCGALGIPFAEVPITREDALAAQEALLSCTSYCLTGVSRLDGRALPWPGPVLGQLLEAWSAEVGVDIARQILSGR